VLALPECDSGNVVALATRGEPAALSLTALHEQAAQLKTATGLDLVPTLKRLEKSGRFPDGKVML
jgi:spermidine synthase